MFKTINLYLLIFLLCLSCRNKKTLKTECFRNTFIQTDGTIEYFKDRYCNFSGRQHVLSIAFPVLFQMLDQNEAKVSFIKYPVSELGIPLIVPFLKSNSVYHNNSSCPFADTFFLLAKEKAERKDSSNLNAYILARSVKRENPQEKNSAKSNHNTTEERLNYVLRSL
jgi:hypothetical protein